LTVDKPNLKLVAHLIGNSLNRRTDNKRMSLQDRTPNGRKVRAATRSRGAPDQQIVCGFNHRAIPFPLRPSSTMYSIKGLTAITERLDLQQNQ
jgi:hypothetical protein